MLTIAQASERRRRTVNAHTPWGLSDSATTFGEGIVFFSTPSHGGFHVDDTRLALMPAELRKTNLAYCGQNWFEEDCEATLVVLAFPQHVAHDEWLKALDYFRTFYPAAYDAYTDTDHFANYGAEALRMHKEDDPHCTCNDCMDGVDDIIDSDEEAEAF